MLDRPASRARQAFFHKTATWVWLYRKGRGPYHGIERPGRRLVHFAYVVARSNNREPGYDQRGAGTGPGEERDTNCLSRRVP
jgi:hypothetical protein